MPVLYCRNYILQPGTNQVPFVYTVTTQLGYLGESLINFKNTFRPPIYLSPCMVVLYRIVISIELIRLLKIRKYNHLGRSD